MYQNITLKTPKYITKNKRIKVKKPKHIDFV